jgi:hypothetical protein
MVGCVPSVLLDMTKLSRTWHGYVTIVAQGEFMGGL